MKFLTRGRSRIFNEVGGGGEGAPQVLLSCRLSRGVWGHAPSENFENLSLLNGHFQHFKTNFLLISLFKMMN